MIDSHRYSTIMTTHTHKMMTNADRYDYVHRTDTGPTRGWGRWRNVRHRTKKRVGQTGHHLMAQMLYK